MAVKTFIQAIVDGTSEEMKRDESIFLFGEDVGVHGGVWGETRGLFDEFGGDRVIDTPITENLIVGLGVGSALMGMRPIAMIQFADFMSLAVDQITQHMAKMRYRSSGGWTCPVVLRTNSGGGVQAGLYHSQENTAWFCHTPGLKVVYPYSPYDAKGLLKSALRQDDPVILYEHKALYRSVKEEIPDEDYVVPIGPAAIRKEGKDLTLVTWGFMVREALKAAEIVGKEGVDVEVIDFRTLVPIDKETLFNSVKKTGRAVIAHEENRTGGFGGELAAILAEEAFDYLDAPICRVCAPDAPPMPFSVPMEKFYMPDAGNIVSGIRKTMAY
jgi:2-oxoisovalerate dehydrogenase E1 component beta subunit